MSTKTQAKPESNSPPLITFADLRSCGYEATFSLDPEASLEIISGYLVNASEGAKLADAHSKAAALFFLSELCFMRLVPSDAATPIHPNRNFHDGRSTLTPQHLTPAQIALISELAPVVQDHRLRARLADLVWLAPGRRNISFALLAIDAYRTHPLDGDAWGMGSEDAWRRAIRLALQLRQGAGDRVAQMEVALHAAFSQALNAQDQTPLWYACALRDLGLAKNCAGKLAASLEQVGHTRFQGGMPSEALQFFDAAADWYLCDGDRQQHAAMLAQAAACWVAQGDGHPSASAKQEFYAKAIAAYREIPGNYQVAHDIDRIISSLRHQLRHAGERVAGEMSVFTSTTDLSDWAEKAADHVTGKDQASALAAFIGVASIPKYQVHFAQAKEMLDSGASVSTIFPTTVIDQGRAVVRRTGADSSPEGYAAELTSQMQHSAMLHFQFQVVGAIWPAMDALQTEWNYGPQYFMQLVQSSPLVPRDRVDMVAKGLHAGFCGDMVQALSILIPQFEHMVRVALRGADTLTTNHSSKGLDTELGLSSLVKRSTMITVFDEDLVFAIRALMCEQEGPNLRNNICHGLVPSALYEGVFGTYAWWLILRLCVDPSALNLF